MGSIDIDFFSVALIVIAYLLGAVPMGIIVAKLSGGVDPREGGERQYRGDKCR